MPLTRNALIAFLKLNGFDYMPVVAADMYLFDIVYSGEHTDFSIGVRFHPHGVVVENYWREPRKVEFNTTLDGDYSAAKDLIAKLIRSGMEKVA